MGTTLKIFIACFVFINIYSFYIMYKDKRNAIKKLWRVPEATLFIFAASLGSIGILLGMYIFHHKTKHIKFIFGIPFILAIQLFVAVMIVMNFK